VRILPLISSGEAKTKSSHSAKLILIIGGVEFLGRNLVRGIADTIGLLKGMK
jgi:hypothetical protein